DKVYKQTIKPYLYSKGIHSIDAIFISHEDMDHMGSVDYLVDEFSVKNIYISPFYKLSEESAHIWSENKVNVNLVEKDHQITLYNTSFNVLSPFRDTESDNEKSLVIDTEIGGLRSVEHTSQL